MAAVTVTTSHMPLESRTMARMPGANPHVVSCAAPVHGASGATASLPVFTGTASRTVACADVCGTNTTLIASGRKNVPLAGSLLRAPMRYGKIAGMVFVNGPDETPRSLPAPPIISPWVSVSTATRRRCCMSATSGCARKVACAGDITASAAAATKPAVVVVMSSSTSVNPRSVRERLMAPSRSLQS